MRLDGKVAVVTGGAHGIGRAAAAAFVAAGARVVIADWDATGAAVAAQALGEAALAVVADVADEASVQQLFDTARERLGRLDVLVNNAGIAVGAALHETTPAAWRRVLQVNLESVYLCSRAALPLLSAAGGGAIVHVASVQGMAGFPRWPAYAAAKGGIIALTRQMAVEYAPDGIRVNAVCPGPIATNLSAHSQGERERLGVPDPAAGRPQAATRQPPLGRAGRPEEVAAAILFLASDAASYVTGHCLVVDGGMMARGG